MAVEVNPETTQAQRFDCRMDWVGFCVTLFEAKAVFIHTTGCILDKENYVIGYTEYFNRLNTSTAAPTTTRWSHGLRRGIRTH